MALPPDISIAPVLLAAAGEGSLVRDFAITLAMAGAALLLFRWLRQPAALGYLVAGVVIGPFTLLPGSLVQNEDTIRRLADLGLVLLLFSIGLEFGWQRIRAIGPTVIVIAVVEFIVMFVLGYQIAMLLGWTDTEGVFLGAALTVSSSAIIIKMLRDTGKLFATQGALIVGILVIEDFLSVGLLTILSGVAKTGEASLASVGLLSVKLTIFAIAALALGALFAPRLVRHINNFHSKEALLVISLALCFGVAVAAEELGLSGAAGAFLIGAALGDTEHSEDIVHVMDPVRDMFSALFFVSIGMLIDLRLAGQFLVPALIVSAVFVVGKVVADTLGAILSGHDGRTSLSVGMGMPQAGEFSLAMVKVGAEQGAVGAFMYPVLTMATAVTALIYPALFRSTERAADFLDRISPPWLKVYGASLMLWVGAMRHAFTLHSPRARRIQHCGKIIAINLVIVVVFIAAGTVALNFTEALAGVIGLPESLAGLLVGGAVIALCLPPGVAIWRSLRTLSDDLASYYYGIRRPNSLVRAWTRSRARVAVRDTLLVILMAIPGIVSLPFIFQLFSLGSFSTPLPILLLVALVAGLGWAAFQIYGVVEATFSRTFLGIDGPLQPPLTRRQRAAASPAAVPPALPAPPKPEAPGGAAPAAGEE